VVAAQAAKVAEEIGKAGKTARSLLNKLTPEKFERIANRFAAEVAVTCAQTLVAVSEVIFDKAVDEPAFCPVYARLCGFLSTRYVSLSRSTGTCIRGWLLMVVLCSDECELTDECDLMIVVVL